MRTVWKFRVDVSDKVDVEITDARLIRWLHVESAGAHGLWLWGIFETTIPGHFPPYTTPIYVRGTGHEFTGEEGDHIGSVMAQPFVWHVFAAQDGN